MNLAFKVAKSSEKREKFKKKYQQKSDKKSRNKIGRKIGDTCIENAYIQVVSRQDILRKFAVST